MALYNNKLFKHVNLQSYILNKIKYIILISVADSYVKILIFAIIISHHQDMTPL